MPARAAIDPALGLAADLRPDAEPEIVELRGDAAGGGWVVVNKPSGLCSVPGLSPDAQDCVLYRIAEMFPEAAGPMIVHRLDMQTSGLLVLALDAETHRELSVQFERRTVGKAYEALVDGVPPERAGVVDLPMRSDHAHRLIQVVDRVQGREARTEYEVVGEEAVRGARCARLRLGPITGRTHQLRLHCAHPWEDGGLGCPILGDNLYGPTLGVPHRADRLLLHAGLLAFDDPLAGERVSFSLPPAF